MNYPATLLIMLGLCAGPIAAARAQAARPNILFAVADDWTYGHAGRLWLQVGKDSRLRPRGPRRHSLHPRLHAQRQVRAVAGLHPHRPQSVAAQGRRQPRLLLSAGVQDLCRGARRAGLLRRPDRQGLGAGRGQRCRRPAAADGGPAVQPDAPPPPPRKSATTTTPPTLRTFSMRAPKDRPWCFWYGGHEPHRAYEYGSGVAKGGKNSTDIDRVPGCWPDNERVRNDLLDYAFEVEHFDRHLGRMLAAAGRARPARQHARRRHLATTACPSRTTRARPTTTPTTCPWPIMWKAGIREPGRVGRRLCELHRFRPDLHRIRGRSRGGRPAWRPPTGRSLTDIFRGKIRPRQSGRATTCSWARSGTDVGRPHDWGYPDPRPRQGRQALPAQFRAVALAGRKPRDRLPGLRRRPDQDRGSQDAHRPGQKRYWDLSFRQAADGGALRPEAGPRLPDESRRPERAAAAGRGSSSGFSTS